MVAHPLALQLHNLQTLVEVAVDKMGAFLSRETAAAATPKVSAQLARTLTANAA